jgi:hypothetical protein
MTQIRPEWNLHSNMSRTHAKFGRKKAAPATFRDERRRIFPIISNPAIPAKISSHCSLDIFGK